MVWWRPKKVVSYSKSTEDNKSKSPENLMIKIKKFSQFRGRSVYFVNCAVISV